MTLRGVEKKRNPYKDRHSGLNILEIVADNGEKRFYDSGIEMRSTALTQFSVGDSDPLSAKAEYEWVREFSRENWQTKTKSNTTITSDLKYFYLRQKRTAIRPKLQRRSNHQGPWQSIHKVNKVRHRPDQYA